MGAICVCPFQDPSGSVEHPECKIYQKQTCKEPPKLWQARTGNSVPLDEIENERPDVWPHKNVYRPRDGEQGQEDRDPMSVTFRITPSHSDEVKQGITLSFYTFFLHFYLSFLLLCVSMCFRDRIHVESHNHRLKNKNRRGSRGVPIIRTSFKCSKRFAKWQYQGNTPGVQDCLQS